MLECVFNVQEMLGINWCQPARAEPAKLAFYGLYHEYPAVVLHI